MTDLRPQFAPLATLAGDDLFLPRCPVKVLLEPDSRLISLPSAPVPIARIFLSFPSCSLMKFFKNYFFFSFLRCRDTVELHEQNATRTEEKKS